MEASRFDEFCRQGEKADTYLMRGRNRDALRVFSGILNRLNETGEVDSYLIAKVTLGILRCHIKLGEFKPAFQIWNSTLDDGLYGVGIYALESAQTTVQDLLIYDLLCGFLHTLADSDANEAAVAVNQYMSRVCEHSLEQADKQIFRMTINNWKQHLRAIFQGTIPHQFAKPLIEFEKQLTTPVKLEPIEFPLPSAWDKPGDFREMSRVVQMKLNPKVMRPARQKNRKVAS